jgi:hypothetical protein
MMQKQPKKSENLLTKEEIKKVMSKKYSWGIADVKKKGTKR